MAFATLIISSMAAAAVSVAAFSAFGSILLAIGTYALVGTLVLFAVIFAAMLKEQAELTSASDPVLFPAE